MRQNTFKLISLLVSLTFLLMSCASDEDKIITQDGDSLHDTYSVDAVNEQGKTYTEFTLHIPSHWKITAEQFDKQFEHNQQTGLDEYLLYLDEKTGERASFLINNLDGYGEIPKTCYMIMADHYDNSREVITIINEAGDLSYLIKNKGIWMGTIFKNNKEYSLIYQNSDEGISANESILKEIINKAEIAGRQNDMENTPFKQTMADNDEGFDNEANTKKLNQLFNSYANEKVTKTVEELDEDELEILGNAGEVSLDINTLYSATRTLLYGLTYADQNIIDLCLLPADRGKGKLSDKIKEFQGPYSNHLLNYEITAKNITEYNNEYKVYLNLDEDVDMQVYLLFNKIGSEYYFESFKY